MPTLRLFIDLPAGEGGHGGIEASRAITDQATVGVLLPGAQRRYRWVLFWRTNNESSVYHPCTIDYAVSNGNG